MIAQNQTNKFDCVRACVASLLEIPIETVPDFTAMREDSASEYPIWWIELQSFLMKRGYIFIEFALTENTPWMPQPYPAMCIMIGNIMVEGKKDGKRFRTLVRHAVVGHIQDGNFLLDHDPLPENKKGFHKGVSGICFLVPCDPARMKYTPGNVIHIPQG